MKRKSLALSLAIIMLLSLVCFQVAAADSYAFWDLRNTANVTVSTHQTTVDGDPITITRYTGYYAADSNNSKQQFWIWVPSNATPDSAILHKVANSGWQSNGFSLATPAASYSTAGSNPTQDALALARGMILVQGGARSRNDAATAGEFLGHSPATMTDSKAVLRLLRYNMQPGMLLDGIGNPDNVFVTGTSGGGALSVILAACGDSPDFYPSLYEIGAAGISYVNGRYISTVSDAYIGTLAYCPITDLAMADQAYEYTYNVSRTMRAANGNVNGNRAEPFENNLVMQCSDWMANDFADYVNGLKLRDERGNVLTATYTPAIGGDTFGRDFAGYTGGTFKDAMRGLLERGINKAINEWAIDNATGFSNADTVANLDTRAAYLQINGAAPIAAIPAFGSRATIYDFDQFLTSVPNSALKIAPAFNNIGTQPAGTQNENDLYGSLTERFNQTHEWGWNYANETGAASYPTIGLANTGLTWDEFLQTANGQLVALQMKMTTPIPYLVGADKIPYLKYANTSDVCKVAPYWYVRHGQADRDTSFAVGTILNYALLNNRQVDSDLLNFNFAWAKTHSGTYDNPEAFAWVDIVLSKVVKAEPTASVEKLTGNKNNLTVTVYETLVSGKVNVYTVKFSIDNNAAGTYQVGPYKVYVDTKGNTQIRECYIVR